MADVLLHPDVEAWLHDQQPDVEQQIRRKLEQAGEYPDHFLTPLKGRETDKLRSGTYRCERNWDCTRDELRVLQAGHRDGFYD
jgi:mRNA-degrading endonuclease RelE of RelBE toxin-antitoxin system